MAEAKQIQTQQPEKLFIFSKFDSIHWIGFRAKAGIHPETKKDVYREGELKLMPGMNEVSSAEWNAAADPLSVVTQHHIKTKKLQVLPSSALPSDEEKAVEYVQQTISESILRDWQRSEDRPDVQTAIEDQLKALQVERKRVTPNDAE